MNVYAVIVFMLFALCEGQFDRGPLALHPPTTLRNGLTEKIGNFSIRLLYHTGALQGKQTNLIISPITMWSVLAITAEGASGQTRAQINNAIRLKSKNIPETRREFGQIAQWLLANTSNVELGKTNVLFIDEREQPEKDFLRSMTKSYDATVIPLDFNNPEMIANAVNQAISFMTKGKITKLIDSKSLTDTKMILTSALYFKGKWTIPFDSLNTSKRPFHSSDGRTIGEVNMMYNRYTYPFANIHDLEAKIIELPYGTENRLSMLVMLPNPGISLEGMFENFNNVTLDTVFETLRISREDGRKDEVDCFIPRFNIESDIDMTPILRDKFNIVDLFDPNEASLPFMARKPMFVSKVVHKATIEVTEEGTVASAVSAVEFNDRFANDVQLFEANRPFSYMIVERVTNTIVFGGIYQIPSLY